MRCVNIGFDRTISHYRRVWPLSFTNYSQLYIVYDFEAEVRRVMKVVPKTDFNTVHYNERSITALMNHPNVTRLVDGFEWKDFDVLIFPRFEGGSLVDAVKAQRFRSVHEVSVVAFRLLLGLNYVHKRSVQHGDISPNNVLFDGESPVLIDFGGADIVRDGCLSTRDVGTPGFCAPERKQKESGLAADIYSMGATICYMLEGNSRKEMNSGLWREAPRSLHELVSSMMHQDSLRRPTAAECLRHACFRELLKPEGITKELEIEGNISNYVFSGSDAEGACEMPGSSDLIVNSASSDDSR